MQNKTDDIKKARDMRDEVNEDIKFNLDMIKHYKRRRKFNLMNLFLFYFMVTFIALMLMFNFTAIGVFALALFTLSLVVYLIIYIGTDNEVKKQRRILKGNKLLRTSVNKLIYKSESEDLVQAIEQDKKEKKIKAAKKSNKILKSVEKKMKKKVKKKATVQALRKKTYTYTKPKRRGRPKGSKNKK